MLLAIYFLAVSCANAGTHSENRWTAEKVIGLHLQLTDPSRLEEYSFTKSYVIPNIGSHDIVVNPLWHWKIRDGRLQIFSESKLEDELGLVEMNRKTVIVRRKNGAIARYNYSYRR